MPEYHSLAISQLDDFIYGTCPKPVELSNGLVIGGGMVYPELNFTLPSMVITPETMDEVRVQYTQMITEACKRAVELYAPGLVVEFELLPELTQAPEWGADITHILSETLRETEVKHALKTALRDTPNDMREIARASLLRQGEQYDHILRTCDLCGKNGAEFLSIE